MAEAVLYNIAEGIITKLGSRALQEIGLWWGVKDDFEKLKRTVSMIKAVLLDAEEQSLERNQVKVWLQILKEAIYDADDLLDEFTSEALRQEVKTGNRVMKEVGRFFSSSNQFACGLKMAHKIQAIRKRLDEIAADRKFHLEVRSEEKHVRNKSREQTHSSVPEIVVGREEDKEAIMELLLSSNDKENISTIPILGIGGLGKTTLAQLVYDDEKIKMHFELRLWACVSDPFDVKLIVEKLIESESREKPRNNEMETLKNLLHEKIDGKKYLIVLDDVWNDDSEKWFYLKDLLVGGAKGSKIIITTRLRRAADLSRPIYVHELKGLNEIESWSLFKRMAFKRGQLPNPSYEAIGKEIVERCSGVPLAIRTIGGLLYFKDSESEWLSFKDKELSKVDQHESDILPTLKLSYNHLPSYLKHCFAFCSFFPKDYEIDVDLLIHLWVAQGYVVSSDPSQCLEDIGKEYFVDLHWRSFFQEVEKDKFGNITHCKMHDLMHDLATQVAGEECVCVLSDARMDNINASSRHLSVLCSSGSGWDLLSSLFKAKKARTFLVLDEERPQMKEKQCHEIFSSLRCLRGLDLRDLQIETLPPSIGKLKHLRFLDLSYNRRIKKLPASITKLHNLQVLKLECCVNLKQLPKDIKNLVNLRSLDNKNCHGLTHMPRGIGQLTFLQKLSRFVIAEDNSVLRDSAGLDELKYMNLLRGELEIANLWKVRDAAFECKAANLKEKRHLQQLDLNWNYPLEGCCDGEVENNEMVMETLEPHQYLKGLWLRSYMGKKLARWFSSLTILVDICFWGCKNIMRLPPLDQLHSLKTLSIDDCPNLEYIDSGINSGGSRPSSFFPCLTDLQLKDCHKLKGWNIEKAELLQFPSLSSLYVMYCPNLTSVPLTPSLKDLWCESTMMASEYSSSSSSSSFPYSLFPSFSQLEKLTIWAEGLRESSDNNGDQLLWQRLKSLRILIFKVLPNSVSLPKGLQYLSTLHQLRIVSCPDLVSLPNGPQYLSSLHSLEIFDCPNLMSLPDWMHNLTALQYLFIYRSPKLAKRCKDNMAPDWPKVAHIPNVKIDNKWIQRNSSYQF